MLLSPQTIRSGLTPASRAGPAELGGQRLRRVRAQARVADHARLHHGDRDLADRGIGRGEREGQRPGADAGQPGGRAQDGQPRPPGGPGQDGRANPRQGLEQEHDGHVGQHQHEADQPDAAHRGQREHGGMLPLADAEHRPRTAEGLPGPQPFGEQPAARHHHQRGQRPRPAQRGPQQLLGGHPERYPQHAEHRRRPAARRARSPAPSSTGPRSGSPAPSHQARTPPSRAVGDLTMSTSPGTSPNQARNSRFAAGKVSTSSAPQSSITPRTDQIHLTGFTSALRSPTLLLSPAVRPGPAAPVGLRPRC